MSNLIKKKLSTLFSDVPMQTNVLVHDIDVGENLPIKQFPFRVNPAKHEAMRAEVEYLLQHGFAVVKVPEAYLVYSSQNQIPPSVFELTIIR